ncbi:thioredoxin [bacterium]|nr:thioredoxin [bacterium]NBV97175.1 thioredoxin [Verrucomicrobiota bacterium]
MAGGNTLTLNESNFDALVLKSSVPVLVDFWAEWCGPCRMIAPLLEQIAKDHPGKVVVGKVNVDTEQALSAKYGIQSIPAFFIFKNGSIAEQFIGAQHSRQSIEAKLGL